MTWIPKTYDTNKDFWDEVVTDKLSRLDVVRLWLDALEGDKFERTQGVLRKEGKFCCLGVACEVLLPHTDFEYANTTNGFGVRIQGYKSPKDNLNNGFLPLSIKEMLGFAEEDGSFTEEKVMPIFLTQSNSLSGLNDSNQYTFQMLADIIKSEPEGLFNYELRRTASIPESQG